MVLVSHLPDAYADEGLEGLGHVLAQLAAATADLGRRPDEIADWLAAAGPGPRASQRRLIGWTHPNPHG